MKLNKIKFASLVGSIERQHAINMSEDEITRLDDLIDIEVEAPVAYPSTADINRLMELMAVGQLKIEAIELHRKLTGWGLKESKDQVEKHWPKLSNHYVPPVEQGRTADEILAAKAEGAKLSDILGKVVGKPEPFGKFSDMT